MAKIPIKKLKDGKSSYYPLGVGESVVTTHDIRVTGDIGGYKKDDIIPALTSLDTILSKLASGTGSGGGDVDIDNDTIVKNADGKISVSDKFATKKILYGINYNASEGVEELPAIVERILTMLGGNTVSYTITNAQQLVSALNGSVPTGGTMEITVDGDIDLDDLYPAMSGGMFKSGEESLSSDEDIVQEVPQLTHNLVLDLNGHSLNTSKACSHLDTARGDWNGSGNKIFRTADGSSVSVTIKNGTVNITAVDQPIGLIYNGGTVPFTLENLVINADLTGATSPNSTGRWAESIIQSGGNSGCNITNVDCTLVTNKNSQGCADLQPDDVGGQVCNLTDCNFSQTVVDQSVENPYNRGIKADGSVSSDPKTSALCSSSGNIININGGSYISKNSRATIASYTSGAIYNITNGAVIKAEADEGVNIGYVIAEDIAEEYDDHDTVGEINISGSNTKVITDSDGTDNNMPMFAALYMDGDMSKCIVRLSIVDGEFNKFSAQTPRWGDPSVDILQIAISGGTFDKNVSQYCAAPYHSVQDSSGKWIIEIDPNYQDGSEEYPWLLSTTDDLLNLKDAVNGTAAAGVKYKANDYYKLANDIDMSEVTTWNGIGLQSPTTPKYNLDPDHTFKGTFDGDGHTIDNLTLHCVGGGTADRYVSFFRAAGYGATIKNLTINVNGVDNWQEEDIMAAAFVGLTNGGLTIENCTANGTLGTVDEPLDNTSGIICRTVDGNNGATNSVVTLTNVTNNVDIVTICKAGGIISYAYGTLNFNNVVNTGDITRIGLDNTRDDAVAGLVGYGHQGGTHVNYNFNGVENSGTITSDLVNYARSAGQLVGKWSAMNTSNTGTVTLNNDNMPLSKNIDPNIVNAGLWFGEVGSDGKIHVVSTLENNHEYVYLFNNVKNDGSVISVSDLKAINRITLPLGVSVVVDTRFGEPNFIPGTGANIIRRTAEGDKYRYIAEVEPAN